MAICRCVSICGNILDKYIFEKYTYYKTLNNNIEL